jgi:hypothetical protein
MGKAGLERSPAYAVGAMALDPASDFGRTFLAEHELAVRWAAAEPARDRLACDSSGRTERRVVPTQKPQPGRGVTVRGSTR